RLGLPDLSNSAMECPARPRRDHTVLLALTSISAGVTSRTPLRRSAEIGAELARGDFQRGLLLLVLRRIRRRCWSPIGRSSTRATRALCLCAPSWLDLE